MNQPYQRYLHADEGYWAKLCKIPRLLLEQTMSNAGLDDKVTNEFI